MLEPVIASHLVIGIMLQRIYFIKEVNALPLRGERGIHTHPLYNVYELRILLNRLERLKKHTNICVYVFIHTGM